MSVKFIGIELEGAFDNYLRIDTKFHSDGSVEIDHDGCSCYCGELLSDETCSCCRGDCDHSDYQYVGELLSIPMTFDKVKEWLFRNYPLEYNKTCGMHVHLSFKNNLEYSKFCSREFYEFFKRKIKYWADNSGVKKDSLFYSRLDSKNGFCKDKFDCKNQLTSMGDRYCILNFCHSKHKTIEIRLSHLWQNQEYAFMYISNCVDIFNEWLVIKKRSIRKELEVRI